MPPRARLAVDVVRNLRMLGLFLIGPGVGVALGAVIFGLPVDMQWMAVGMFAISLALLGILVRAEWRRLSRVRSSHAR